MDKLSRPTNIYLKTKLGILWHKKLDKNVSIFKISLVIPKFSHFCQTVYHRCLLKIIMSNFACTGGKTCKQVIKRHEKCVKFNVTITKFDGILPNTQLKSFTGKVLGVSGNSFFLIVKETNNLGHKYVVRTYVSW